VSFVCSPISPLRWTGHYRRIPGKTTAFHVRLLDGVWWPVVDWSVRDTTAECPMVDAQAAATLVDAVNAGKRAMGTPPGGSFHINEHGQVLVPASDSEFSSRVVMVASCSGPLWFRDSFRGDAMFDLTDPDGLTTGSRWSRPYVGIPYNLSAGHTIYFRGSSSDGVGGDHLPPRYDELVAALRSLRPHGGIRFMVTYGGIILTKVPTGPWNQESWEPTFVGRLDYSRWYRKEG
jgi:hypothetical protein